MLTVFTFPTTRRAFNFRWLFFRYDFTASTDAGFAEFPAPDKGGNSDFFLSSTDAVEADARCEITSTISSRLNTSAIPSRLNGIGMFSHPVRHVSAASRIRSNFSTMPPVPSDDNSPTNLRCWLSVGDFAKIRGCDSRGLSTSLASTIVIREDGSRLRGIRFLNRK